MGSNRVEKKIVVTERSGISRTSEFVRVGIPFAKGELFGTDGFSIVSPDREHQPVQAVPLSCWGDGSVKWGLIDFVVSISACTRAVYRLVTDSHAPRATNPGVLITQGADAWVVDTGAAVFSINLGKFGLFSSVKGVDGELLSGEGNCMLVTADNETLSPTVDAIALESEGLFRTIVAIEGSFGDPLKNVIRFSHRIHFFPGSSRVIVDVAVHNPQPARHPGGLWDLGDSGSLLFRELTLDIPFPGGGGGEIICSAEPGSETIRLREPAGEFVVYQESSGGENWSSPAHRTGGGGVPLALCGYEIREGQEMLAAGRRSTPVIWCGSALTGISAVLPRFWQEFPKLLAADRRSLRIGLFPDRFPALHELQGGEQKTHRIHLDFAAAPGGLDWAREPLAVAPSPETVRCSGVVRECIDQKHGATISHLIGNFIAGPDEFFRKRELVDEFGWRNFGELTADHEAVYHEGAEPFVSHYNNQYDPCGGMYRMFFDTGDPAWGELAADLARHLLDIDIYHTTGDREEYNHGLFWHTDHYVPAGLATHRSFSREQIGSRDPRYCGGGPGAEHCYTTGLMLHYFQTGDQCFRDAVIGLAEWCYRSISGSQPVLAAAKRAVRHFSLLRSAVGQPFPRFPLSRGTGNALNACLDAYEVCGDRKFLNRAEELIRGSLYPDEDPGERNLLDAENSWSYTVLLVAVAKYLDTLCGVGERGGGYDYARACLLRYAEWMRQYEYPFLERPEILEYPNETWPAQDLRKSVIFYHAARYAEPGKRDAFLGRGRFFFITASDELMRHSTSRFTRPLALMLQNGWVGAALEEGAPLVEACPVHGMPSSDRSLPRVGIPSVLARIGNEFRRALGETSMQREIAWLKARMRS